MAQDTTSHSVILNNTPSLTIGKTSNKVVYGFSLRRLLNFFSSSAVSNTYKACTDAIDTILFALANQKVYYDQKYQCLFIKIGDWAMLRLQKGYSISSSVGVTKKLIQQYVSSFLILERVGHLTYKLNVSSK